MAKEITLHIDGREVAVSEGTTILQAAAGVGIEIPHLCYFEGLPPSGSCRLCLVEIEGQSRLAVSCMQRVKQGMVVQTSSDRVRNSRRFILELIWSTHDGDCTTCEKAGACDLQRYTYDLDVDKEKYALYTPDEIPSDLGDPLIERDLRLCILCGRCIRACREKSQGILDFMERGMSTIVTTSLNKPLVDAGCDFCGSCIDVCPVGCLVERDRKLRGREWEFETAETLCGHCSLVCSQAFDLAHGQIVRARPGSDGYLCVRGKFGWDYLRSDERVSKPLVRNGSDFEEVAWDKALDRIAARLGEIRTSKGAEAIGGLIGTNVTNEAVHAFGVFLREAIGTKSVGSAGGGVATGVLSTFGSLAALATPADVERSKKILAVGPSLGESYPRARLAIKRAVDSGAKLVVVDPDESGLTRMATVHLKPKAGSEAAVLEGIARALVDAGLHNAESVDAIDGASDAVGRIRAQDAGRTGVPDGQIVEAAKLLAKGKGTIVTSDLRCGTLARSAALLMLTGRMTHGLLPLHPSANPWGNVLLGRDESKVPTSGVAGLIVVGADPVANGGLQDVDFLVVQDLFLTETARKADVVLPLNGFPEEEGTVLGAGGKLIPVTAAAPPVAPPSWQTFAELAERLGHELGFRSVRDVRAAVKEAVRGLTAGSALHFPALNDTSDPGELKPYDRFELPEPAWTARSQLQGGRAGLDTRTTKEEVAA